MSTDEKALVQFIDELCVDWGFCIPAAEKEKIVTCPRLTAREFTIALLHAEGRDDPTSTEWFSPIMRRFEQRFGKGVVSGDTFKL